MDALWDGGSTLLERALLLSIWIVGMYNPSAKTSTCTARGRRFEYDAFAESALGATLANLERAFP